MLTRRDKLLIQPWQQRKYEHHIRKVKSALPAIDNHPPAHRNHVLLKLKQKQNENERCSKIEKDNLLLLQKLNNIMRTNRVDNYWTTPQPNFLNRISIYKSTEKKESKIERDEDFPADACKHRSKCLACTPQKKVEPIIPEERIPWEPNKPPVRKIRSKSVPVQKLPKTFDTISLKGKSIAPKNITTSKKSKTSYKYKSNLSLNDNLPSPQSIILNRGSLVLAVNFPSDTFVKLKDGCSEKLIIRGECQCKSSIV